MKFKEFVLDPFQEEAINAIKNNQSVVVSAPTGSGKTLIAEYIIDLNKNNNKRIIYTAPIKALSNQKYKDFSQLYGEDKVGLMTGDFVINPTAKIIIMTTEIYRNMVVANDESINDIVYVIFDEIHYINDVERGYVWEESIIYSSENIRFLCLSATIPNAQEFSNWIQAIKNHEVATVIATKRNVPLHHAFFDYELGLTTLEKIRDAKRIPHYRSVVKKRGAKIPTPAPNHVELIKQLGDKLPCLFFTFSRRSTQLKARELARKGFFDKNPQIMTIFHQHLREAPPEVSKLMSTKILLESLPQGIAFHHAGLLPVIKTAVEDLFGQGLIKVLYTTETFAVGINMPAKTVCFDGLRKYDGMNFRYLNSKEYFQIAGRAGRRGIDTVGYVVSMVFRPTFNYHEIKRITSQDIDPIQSQFRLSINTVLNLINLHTPDDIAKILRLSFFSYQKFGEKYADVPTKVLLARYNSIIRKLEKYEYIIDKALTPKGHFSSRVFADEITTGEIFATEMVNDLDEYQILLVVGALAYEHRPMNKFKKFFRNEQLKNLKTMLYKNEFLAKEKKFLNLDMVTTLIHPIYNGLTFFDLMDMTNLLEGDLIRFFSQVLDRLGQIRKATADIKVRKKVENCEGIVKQALEGIYLV